MVMALYGYGLHGYMAYVVMACVVMVHTGTAYIIMAYIVMANIVMAYKVMANTTISLDGSQPKHSTWHMSVRMSTQLRSTSAQVWPQLASLGRRRRCRGTRRPLPSP